LACIPQLPLAYAASAFLRLMFKKYSTCSTSTRLRSGHLLDRGMSNDDEPWKVFVISKDHFVLLICEDFVYFIPEKRIL
uniref:Secreted protein n=1 Tax=Hydatigena taeniaeformis TaxID=6205 RepID=A0A0R3WPA2_HYDTA